MAKRKVKIKLAEGLSPKELEQRCILMIRHLQEGRMILGCLDKKPLKTTPAPFELVYRVTDIYPPLDYDDSIFADIEYGLDEDEYPDITTCDIGIVFLATDKEPTEPKAISHAYAIQHNSEVLKPCY